MLEAKGLGHSSCHKGSEEEEVAFLSGQFFYSLQTCPTNCQSFPSESSQGSCCEASKKGRGLPRCVCPVFLVVEWPDHPMAPGVSTAARTRGQLLRAWTSS